MNNSRSSIATPKSLGYHWPAEWESHEATWISWPHNRKTWPEKFDPVPNLFCEFIRTVARFEPVHVLVQEDISRSVWNDVSAIKNVKLRQITTNDCWIRDYGPWFLSHAESQQQAVVDWRYNAWGEKYPPFDADNQVPGQIAKLQSLDVFRPGLVMEAGAVENNGAGVLMVTSQCLLNPNRNPNENKQSIENFLCEFTGASKVLWLFEPGQGSLAGDDTDAHIDQLARFVSTSTIVACREGNRLDVNYLLLEWLHHQLREQTDASGKHFDVIDLPMPAPVYHNGQRLPASYANFYVGNGFVVLPEFGCAQDKIAMGILKDVFPGREIIMINAVDLIWGLGAFHCVSMQQ
ncbi:MAG: agmatine deiminase family protein [Planctomycetaceae bacterium]|nr:agmatine deiminase family protein [Planctomycetaceae bacterium]